MTAPKARPAGSRPGSPPRSSPRRGDAALWADAALDETVLPKSLTRFRSPWRWDGGPAVLVSRATDETGAVQPMRKTIVEGSRSFYHYNGLQAWQVATDGELSNVYI